MATNISTILIDAPAEKVWQALTQAEKVKLWQYGSELSTSWVPGSDIRFTTEWQGSVFEQWGQVLEFQPYQSLKYSLFAPRPGLEDRPENYFTMAYVLTELNGQTKLDIIQQDDRPNARQEDPQGEENPVLKTLKSIAELS